MKYHQSLRDTDHPTCWRAVTRLRSLSSNSWFELISVMYAGNKRVDQSSCENVRSREGQAWCQLGCQRLLEAVWSRGQILAPTWPPATGIRPGEYRATQEQQWTAHNVFNSYFNVISRRIMTFSSSDLGSVCRKQASCVPAFNMT